MENFNNLKPGSVCAVITTFKPDVKILDNIAQVAKQVDWIIIVDDTGKNCSFSQELISLKSCLYLANSRNLGIAASLNIGVQKAIELGYNYILTLDDDTRLVDDYVACIKSSINSLQSVNIGLIACSRSSPTIHGEKILYTEKRTLITSGCFFSKEIYLQAGGFDERFFIDLVDFDFAMKVKKMNCKLILLSKMGMLHKVGNSNEIEILKFRFTVFNHSPFRLYYQIRNAIFFFKMYYSQDIVLSCYILFDLIRIPIKAILFENRKMLRLGYIALGLFDGFRGHYGKIGKYLCSEE